MTMNRFNTPVLPRLVLSLVAVPVFVLLGFTWFKGTSEVIVQLKEEVVLHIAVDPCQDSTIYAGTMLGIYKSTNAGKSWQDMSHGLKDPWIRAICIDFTNPSVLYAVSDTLYRSENGGKSWMQIDPDRSVLTAALSSCDSSVLFVADSRGILKCGNGGSGCERVLENEFVNVIITDKQNPACLYAGTNNGVYKSTDEGMNWKASGLEYKDVACMISDPVRSGHIYAGTYVSGLFRSTDAGMSWEDANEGMTGRNVSCLVINPRRTSTIYLGTQSKGVFVSGDYGKTWRPRNEGLTVLSINSLVIKPSDPTVLYAGTSRGVFKSVNSGATWFELKSFTKFTKKN